MDVSNCLKKFTLLLDYIFDGKVVLNEYNTEKLLKYFEDKNENSTGKRLLDTPCFSDLIFSWLETVSTSTTDIKLLFVKIVTKLFKNELQFNKLQMQGVLSSFQYCILGNLSSKTCPALQLASIKLATAQISHCSGVKLLLEHKIWEYILSPDIHQKPSKIAKASYDFISQLIQSLNHYEREKDLIEVLKYVVKPIIENEYLALEEIDDETDKALAGKIWSHLNAMLTILTDMENEPANHVYGLLRTYFCIDQSLFIILRITRYTSLINLINDINLRLFYSGIRTMIFTNKTDEVCSELVAFYHNTVIHCINKRDVNAIIDFSVKCYVFWSTFERTYKDTNVFTVPLMFERNGQKFELCNQVIVHVIQPLFLYAYYNNSSNTVSKKDDLVEALHTKMTRSITEHILSSCYLFKTLIDVNNRKKMAIVAIRQFFRLKSHLNPSQAGIAFQVLYHILNLFIVSDGAGRLILEENPMKCPDDVRLLSLVLDAIRMIMKEHNISWYENVEIISLQEGLMNLMKQNVLNTKQEVQVLDLINICMNKFLSPNMTLLVESRQDSTLTEIGAVMNKYMQHEEWEVRDSATTLLLSCTDIAYIKYVPLQQVIRENNLMILAAKIALTDSVCYAQSTGLKCLAAATKLESIWRQVVLDNLHIYLQLVNILRNHPEGMVRKEAAKVLTGVYKNQKVIPTFQNTLNEVMMLAALDDLHWEVQLEALEFWKLTIKDHLSHRGMIDGKFPTVTFSKEKRKIITLNNKEIINQLTSIMNDLSSIGCLTVLLDSMHEDNHIEIIEKAHGMAKELIEILEKHKFVIKTDNSITDKEVTPMKSEERNNEEDMAVDFDFEPDEVLRNKVIDCILGTDLSELIIDLHDNKKKTELMDDDNRVNVSRKEMVQPDKFLETFKATDYLSIINNKKNWNADNYRTFCGFLSEFLDV